MTICFFIYCLNSPYITHPLQNISFTEGRNFFFVFFANTPPMPRKMHGTKTIFSEYLLNEYMGDLMAVWGNIWSLYSLAR